MTALSAVLASVAVWAAIVVVLVGAEALHAVRRRRRIRRAVEANRAGLWPGD